MPLLIQEEEKKSEADEEYFDLFNSFKEKSAGFDGYSKCEWLRSQVIGADAEFDGPFGRRRITYSDHTASGRFLKFVEEFFQRNVLPFYGNTHTEDSYVGLHTTKLVDKSAKLIKKCMGSGPTDALLFCGSGSTAAIKRLQEVMGIAVPSTVRSIILNHLPSSDRWVVFVGPYEHHSNLLSWRQSLAQVVEIGLSDSGLVDIDSLQEALKSSDYIGRPKLGSFSACSNVSGIHTDTREIARVLHQHGAYACFDFACSGPYANIDMRSGQSDGYDAVFLSPHKFIGGPGSPGILLMSEALYKIKGSPPSTSGGGTVLYVSGHDKKDVVYSDDVEEREDAGTPAIVQKIRAAMAFSVKEWMGHVFIREKESCLVQRALQRLLSNPHVRILGSTCTDRQPIISFNVYPEGQRGKHLHCRFVTKLLNDLFGIQARGGCACAGPYGHVLLGIDKAQSKLIKSAVERGYNGVKPGWTRVSFPYYSSAEEMEFVVGAVEFVASRGRRFLPLYSFDWKTGNWEFSHDHRNTLPLELEGKMTRNYDDVMTFARGVADALPDLVVAGSIPDFIDPQLVTFVV
ncbi:uncharacterized protein A4U43_C01F12220 [Asparagus officinalis]|uniref:Aminotransferase class V domain-containing protein n=1 Tax=Asparagus officinalis TaxID=4686 RepID=A0A5P1FPK2_ASPOF|nr:uncharacterized protein LOC109832490 [Asparagus officinalis]ONK79954.1 uncharacterized protein A4U43_C01F12220 [Asparagus officinalis]